MRTQRRKLHIFRSHSPVIFHVPRGGERNACKYVFGHSIAAPLNLASNIAPLFAVITVPEPTAELLLALGSIGLFGLAVVSRTKIVSY